jgi:hypothetical protein
MVTCFAAVFSSPSSLTNTGTIFRVAWTTGTLTFRVTVLSITTSCTWQFTDFSHPPGWTVAETGSGHEVTLLPITTAALLFTSIAIGTIVTTLRAVVAMVARLAQALASLWVTAGGILVETVALVDAVLTPGISRTWQVARWTKQTRVTLAVTVFTVAAAGGARLRTATVARQRVVTRWATIFTLLSFNARRTVTLPCHDVTRSTVLARTQAVAVQAIRALWTRFITNLSRPTGSTQTSSTGVVTDGVV